MMNCRHPSGHEMESDETAGIDEQSRTDCTLLGVVVADNVQFSKLSC
jgi:hypothetical protein